MVGWALVIKSLAGIIIIYLKMGKKMGTWPRVRVLNGGWRVSNQWPGGSWQHAEVGNQHIFFTFLGLESGLVTSCWFLDLMFVEL